MGKSSSSEDYLKCILVLQKKNDSVRSIDIAEEMGVTKHTISDETYERMDEFVNAHEEKGEKRWI